MIRLSIVSVALAATLGLAQPPPDARAVRARSILESAIADKNPDTRRDAALVLSLAGQRGAAAQSLASLLTDKDIPVRIAAIQSLGELQDSHFLPALEKALDDDVPEVAFEAAKTLWLLKRESGRDALLAVFEKEQKARSNFITSKARNTLRQLKRPKSAMLFAVHQGVGFIPLPGLGEGLSAAESLLFDAEFSPRANALLLLARAQTPEIEAAVLQGLADDDWSVRAASAQVLALWKKPALRSKLPPLFDDKKDKVRLRAAAVYLRLLALEPPPRRPRPAAKKS